MSSGTRRILRAVVATIRPRGHGFDQPIDEEVLAEIDRTLPYLSRISRDGLPIGLRVLEWQPLLLPGRRERLSRMSRDDARVPGTMPPESPRAAPPARLRPSRARLPGFLPAPYGTRGDGGLLGPAPLETTALRADTLGRADDVDPR